VSALSIFKPEAPPAPKTSAEVSPAKPSAAALLGAATKKPAKGSSHLTYTGEAGRDAAALWLQLVGKLDEVERELAFRRDQVLDVIRPWHEEACARRRAHESTVVIDCGQAGALRVSFQHRYGKLPLDREAELQAAVNGDFDRFFKRTVALKVKKEVAEDPARLEQLVVALAESIGADNFAELFEVEQSLTPTKAFTETSCQLPAETRIALSAAGVKQVVALAAK